MINKVNKKRMVMNAKLIAHYISRIVPELKLINFSDYVFYIATKKWANVRDIIDTSTELHFMPSSIQFNNSAEYILDWNKYSILRLGLIFKSPEVKVSFILTLAKNSFSITIENIDFKEAVLDPEFQTEKLQHALDYALLKPINN